jgi:hypothetical protein
LRHLNFDVVEGIDLGRTGMTDKLREFADKSAGADVALFYYAGHGISLGGKNYLIPVDADLKSEVDVGLNALNLEDMIAQTTDAKTKLVLLDACRDNPFAARIRSAGTRKRTNDIGSGLAKMESSRGTLIAFATEPGNTALDGKAGEHSPFTKALLANVAEPGLEIRLALTKVRAQVVEETRQAQMPWESTNLTGFFYMNPKVAALPNAGDGSSVAPSGTTPATDVELEYWRTVKDSNKIEELKGYLFKFPSGFFAPIARTRIAELQAAEANRAPAGAEDEQQLRLTPNKRRTIQRRLQALDLYDGEINGKFDSETRSAIERWQVANDYAKSGYLTVAQYSELMAEQRTFEPGAPAPRQRYHGPRQRGPGFQLHIPRIPGLRIRL